MSQRGGGQSADRARLAERWLTEHGDALYRFALRRLGHSDEAEDAVQEALLAALQAVDSYRHEAAERTWLIGILLNKVRDVLRRRQRERARLAELEASAGGTEACFAGGQWRTRQTAWSRDVADAFASAEFRAFYFACVDDLPEALRTAYCLRELDGLESSEVCEILGVTQTNLWTLVHRAKLVLRARLAPWFEAEA